MNGGISMHSIYQSEIAHFKGEQARALRDITAKALRSGDQLALENARTFHIDHPVNNSAQSVLGLDLALGDLHGARQLVDAQLISSQQVEYWEVQDLYVDLFENNDGPEDVDANGIQLLQAIASTRAYGSGHAQAWLSLFGQTFEDVVVFPTRLRAVQQQEDGYHTAPAMLDVLPNPSNGPVAIAIRLPEEMNDGKVRVVDPLGRLVLEQSFTGNVQLIELDTKGLGNGLFAAEVKADGILVGTIKFEILR